MPTRSTTTRGVTLNVIASLLFALLFAYTPLLSSLTGDEIYAWRILLTFPCLTLFILYRGYGSQIVALAHRVHDERCFLATRLVSSLLIGVQLWLFMWAPGNGQGLAVSLGYFMMPIVMVLVGRVAFRDRLSRFQRVASLLALLGVLSQLMSSQTLAWPTWVVCLGYPLYFWLRRVTNTNTIGGLWLDMLLSLPACIYLTMQGGYVLGELAQGLHILWMLAGLGLLSALALVFQALSAPLLNLSLFGLLVYVEPVFLLMVALAFGEAIQPGEWPMYLAIWSAVAVLVLEASISVKKARQAARSVREASSHD